MIPPASRVGHRLVVIETSSATRSVTIQFRTGTTVPSQRVWATSHHASAV